MEKLRVDNNNNIKILSKNVVRKFVITKVRTEEVIIYFADVQKTENPPLELKAIENERGSRNI